LLCMTDNVKLTIDGKEVEIEKGATVLQAARKAGVYIPTLCFHPDLQPSGGCRLCIVEIENMRGLPTSCTTPAVEGMKVTTSSTQLQELRKTFMQLILTEHPNACLTCERRVRCKPNDICLRHVGVDERCVTCAKNKRCEFREVVDYIGITETTLPYKYKGQPVDFAREPLIRRDYNFCILCGKCVQACADMRGIGAVGFQNRGFDTTIGTAFDRPLQDSSCRFCGACVEVCPTGALTDTAAAFLPEKHWEESGVPCKYACPAGINVPLYVYLAGEGKFQESLAIVREKVPFPASLGRVCIHPCEQACRREALTDPISIKFLKRFVADRDMGFWKDYVKKVPPTGKKVAIVGAGPAGLTAGYYLAKAGHTVTVYEQFAVAGGMMRVGIPDYRLPPDVLEKEINTIKEAGVEIKLNTKIENIDDLFKDGYQAVFLAPGAHHGQTLGVEGENLPGVYDGAYYLREVNLGKKVPTGNKVAVIGAGNVAIDAARVALRTGAKDIHIIYRRTRAEMPAADEEIEAALEEGIKIDLLTSHLKVTRKGDKLILTCNRNSLGEKDASGRRRPVAIKGSEFDVEYDSIIAAIGQVPDIPKGFKVQTGRNSSIHANRATLATTEKAVWAGGDAVPGRDEVPLSVIRAINHGRIAAQSIDKYLGGRGNIEEELTIERKIKACAGITPEDFKNQRRVKMLTLPTKEVVDNFSEVEIGLLNDDAVREGKRCFQCGIRNQISRAPEPPYSLRKHAPNGPDKVKA
jgi:formate dehydrogenase (NADP+) beta subunit